MLKDCNTSTSNMFAAQPAVSGHSLYYSPSSWCLQTFASSTGFKRGRGWVQLASVFLLFFIFLPQQCSGILVPLFSTVLFFSPQGRGWWKSNRCITPSQLIPLLHKSTLFNLLHLVEKLHCLVATRSSNLHCSITRSQTILSSQICAIGHWRWGFSEILSAFGRLRLDLCILRCGGTAFNVLMIKRESFLTHSSWVTCTACLRKEKSDPYFCPKLSLLFDSQCALWFWYHRGRRERKQQAEVFQS